VLLLILVNVMKITSGTVHSAEIRVIRIRAKMFPIQTKHALRQVQLLTHADVRKAISGTEQNVFPHVTRIRASMQKIQRASAPQQVLQIIHAAATKTTTGTHLHKNVSQQNKPTRAQANLKIQAGTVFPHIPRLGTERNGSQRQAWQHTTQNQAQQNADSSVTRIMSGTEQHVSRPVTRIRAAAWNFPPVYAQH
jgi:hypothetical protein